MNLIVLRILIFSSICVLNSTLFACRTNFFPKSPTPYTQMSRSVLTGSHLNPRELNESDFSLKKKTFTKQERK